MKKIINSNLLALTIFAGMAGTGLAQTTAFTYQGRLNDTGAAANGSYDISFAAYDAPIAGNLISALVTNSAVTVSNGLFTTTVDFGSGVFTGSRLWLEIAVTTNAADVFSIIAPRQEFTPTPYAIFAGTSANVAGGSVVTSLNGLKDDLTLAAGNNVTLTPSGNTLTIDAANGGGSSIWSQLNYNAYYNLGNVGLGITTPAEKLTIAGVTSFNTGLKLTGNSASGTGLAVENTSSGGHKFDLLSGGTSDGIGVGAFGIYDETSGNYRLSISSGGNVGIGTLTPAAKLTVHDSVSVSHRVETAGGNNAWARSEFANGNGQWNVGTSRGYNGDALYFNRDGVAFDALDLQPNGDAFFGGNVTMNGAASVSHRIHTSGGNNAWTRVEFANANGQWNVGTSRGYNGDQLYFNRDGVSGNALALQPNGDAAFSSNVTVGNNATINGTAYVTGNASVCSLSIRGGCDLAEPFATTETEVEKGSVVVIDPAHPGQLKLSNSAYDTRVAGVVSGANGINPGIAMHQEGALEGGQNIALSGRVYVQADAANGAIEPGDLLTTSEMPGRAMKVTDHSRAQGAIIGKAMTSLAAGKGLVLVLVTLQ